MILSDDNLFDMDRSYSSTYIRFFDIYNVF